MWVNSTRLPHLLEPRDYHDGQRHRREIERVFLPGWHCVGALDDLPRSGDFATFELYGTPILLRNDDGRLSAFTNVCAHRHCLVTHAPRGSSERIVCQYHGWEYDGHGRLACMPDAQAFALRGNRGDDRSGEAAPQRLALYRHRLETLGRLVFVSLSEEAPALDRWLGARTVDLIRAHFGRDYQLVAARRLEHPANWKVVVENSLESYHVPRVHPTTFKRLVDAREIRHELDPRGTTHEDIEQGESAAYRWLMRRVRRAPEYRYLHRHAFPNLTFACTDVTSVLQVVMPSGPTRSHSLVRLFVHGGDRGRPGAGAISRAIAPVATRFMDAVMREDGVVFEDIQRGLEASAQRGVLGAREERVYAFQRWMVETLGRAGPTTGVALGTSELAVSR